MTDPIRKRAEPTKDGWRHDQSICDEIQRRDLWTINMEGVEAVLIVLDDILREEEK